MKKYDIWLYALTIEAISETEALEKVSDVLNRALNSCKCGLDKSILSSIQVDYAEEIQEYSRIDDGEYYD